MNITAMEKKISRRFHQGMSPSSEDQHGCLQHHASSHLYSPNRQRVRSLHSPPPLISNRRYSNEKRSSNLDGSGSAFMMQFMTAAAAAAMAASCKKSDARAKRPEPHSSIGSSLNATNIGRRCSSSFSSGQDASPSSTTSSNRSLCGQEKGRVSLGSRSGGLRIVGDAKKAESVSPDDQDEDEEINVFSDEQNKSSGRRSGCSLPLPPGAVPVGTLPHPPYHSTRHSALYGLFTKSKLHSIKSRVSKDAKLLGIKNQLIHIVITKYFLNF